MFECGNIDQVRQRSEKEFDCWMRNDTNGTGNLQWFYFRIRNPDNYTEVIRINIVNFSQAFGAFKNTKSSAPDGFKVDSTSSMKSANITTK